MHIKRCVGYWNYVIHFILYETFKQNGIKLTSACVVFGIGAANVAAIVKDTDKTNRNNGSVFSRSIFHSFDMFGFSKMTESKKRKFLLNSVVTYLTRSRKLDSATYLTLT